MNIFQIDRRLDEIYDSAVDFETGEVNAEITDELLTLYAERDEKIENFALWHKNCLAESEAIAKEIKTLQDRKKRLDSKTAWIDSVLKYALNGEKFETPRVQIGYRKSTVVEIADDEAFCERYSGTDFIKTKIETAPNKEEIKKALKNGDELDGAELITKQNMWIR